MKRSITSAIGLFALIAMAGTPTQMTLSEKAVSDAKGNTLVLSAGEKPTNSRTTTMSKPRRAASDVVTIVDEDFSLMEGGSQDIEELEKDTNYLGKPGDPYINDSLTHEPGWSTLYGLEADGALALATNVGGALNTPEGDYSGKLTISFKMKAPKGKAVLIVSLCSNGIYDVYGLLDSDYVRINEETEDPCDWHEYTMTFNNRLSNNTSFVQFHAIFCQVLLDDIKITADYSDFLPAPTALEATDFTLEGFTANWTDVRIADSYLISAYSRTQTGPEKSYTYGFDDGQIPEGWTADQELTVSPDRGVGNSGSLIVDKDCQLESPDFNQNIKSFEVWFRHLTAESYFAMLNVEGFDGYKWTSLGDLSIGTMATDEKGSSLRLDGSVKASFHDAYSKIRLKFKGWDEEAEYGLTPVIAIDDIKIETMPASQRNYVVKDESIDDTHKVITGLDPSVDYFYQVASVRGDLTSWSAPIRAFGITTPIAEPATNITASSYEANWQPTPKATAYHLHDFAVFEATRNEDAYEVLHETFAPAAECGGDVDNPVITGNYYQYVYLNEYCDNPGWNGSSTIIADGMVGSGMGAFQGINTPELTLNNGNGEFDVEVTVYVDSNGYGDAITITPSSAKSEYIGFEAADGFNTVKLHYYDGSASESLKFSTQQSSPFYLKEVNVTQDLNAGDKVYSYRQSKYIEDPDATSYTFENVDFASEPVHAFDVMAILMQDYKECTSAYSTPTLVQQGSKVETNVAVSDVLVRVENGGAVVTAGKEGKADIYALDGTFVATSNLGIGENFIPLAKGVYILKAGGKPHKIMIK